MKSPRLWILLLGLLCFCTLLIDANWHRWFSWLWLLGIIWLTVAFNEECQKNEELKKKIERLEEQIQRLVNYHHNSSK